MATPHNEAAPGSIAKTVLMPGDPLRAQYIARTYLKDPVQFNSVRGMLGFTGTYKDTTVSVMGSGMGMPSIGIYSYELYKFYNVENIIRIGSAGSYTHTLQVMDIVLAESAWSESTFAMAQAGVEGHIQYPTQSLNDVIMQRAKMLGLNLNLCRVHSSDVFYHEDHVDGYREFYEKHGCACVEMESYGLFHNARILGRRAGCLLTISDSFADHRELTAKERETSFDDMMRIALESARACL